MGIIREWSAKTQQGTIEKSDEKTFEDSGVYYPFSTKEWDDDDWEPEVDGCVHFLLRDGRKISHLWYQNMEPPKYVRGPGRMYLDARAWMDTAAGLHGQFKDDMSSNLRDMFGETCFHIISFRGSVIKYCYGLAVELYLKWLLTENNIKFNADHRLRKLMRLLPDRIVGRLRILYSSLYCDHMNLAMKEINSAGISSVAGLDWSTFDSYVGNLEAQRFVVGRYATPESYSIFPSREGELSVEMNRYMDSIDFFHIATGILSFIPGYTGGDQEFPRYGFRVKVYQTADGEDNTRRP